MSTETMLKDSDETKQYQCMGPIMYIDADNEEEARQTYLDLLEADEVDCVEMD